MKKIRNINQFSRVTLKKQPYLRVTVDIMKTLLLLAMTII